MDEAEALSTKMGIMVKGGIFKCFGSAQHIKNKFGTGYVIEIKIKTLDESELLSVEDKYFKGNDIDLTELSFDEAVKATIGSNLEELSDSDKWRQVHSDVNLYACVRDLCNTFSSVEVLEKYGNYMRVRI